MIASALIIIIAETQPLKPANSISATMRLAPLTSAGQKYARLPPRAVTAPTCNTTGSRLPFWCQRQFSTQMHLQSFYVPFVLDGTEFASFLPSLVTSTFYLKMQESSLRWPTIGKGENKFYQIKGKRNVHRPLSSLKCRHIRIIVPSWFKADRENHSYLLQLDHFPTL